MRELYVYYRVREELAGNARAAVLAMQEELRALHPGLVARLLTRHEEDGPATWMEIYVLAAGAGSTGVGATVESEVARHATRLAPFIQGARHVEAFDSDD